MKQVQLLILLIQKQFDIEISAKYRSDRLSIDVFPTATVAKGLNDLEKVVAGLRPSLNQTRVQQNVQLTNRDGGLGPLA